MANLGAYWRTVFVRALSRTLAAVGHTPAKVGEYVALFVAIAGFAIVLGLIADKVESVMLGFAGAGFVAAGALVYQMILTPAAIWEEQTDEIAALKKATATKKEQISGVKALEDLCALGRQLQERYSLDEEWCLEVEVWNDTVGIALEALPDAAFGYRSLPGILPRTGAPDHFLSSMEFLDLRINKLREVIVSTHNELRESQGTAKAAAALK
jgi:hypothetical protein